MGGDAQKSRREERKPAEQKAARQTTELERMSSSVCQTHETARERDKR